MKYNPARRLRNIVFDTYKITSGQSAQRSWAHFFRIDEQNTVEVCRQLLQLVDLIREVRQIVERLDFPGTNIHLTALEELEPRLLPANLSQSWQSVNTSRIMDALKFCEEAIDRNPSQRELRDDIQDKITSDIEDLTTEIKNSNVAHELKEYISEILGDIKQGSENYEILGDKGLQKPCHCLIGTVIVNITELKENAPEFYRKVPGFLGFVADSIAVLTFASDKLPYVMNLLN